MIEFTTDEPTNQVDLEMPYLDETSENNASDHEDVVSDHEEEVRVKSPDENEVAPKTRNPPGYLKDYVIGREAEEDDLQNGLVPHLILVHLMKHQR